MPPAGAPSAGLLEAGAVGDGDGGAPAGVFVDSPDVLAGSPDARPGDSPEAGVAGDPAADGSAGAGVVGDPVVDGSPDADGATGATVDCWADADADVGDPPPGASPEPVVEAWIDVLSAPAARVRSVHGRTFRKCSAAGGASSMPCRTAHEVMRSLAPSSEFSMLSAAFSR